MKVTGKNPLFLSVNQDAKPDYLRPQKAAEAVWRSWWVSSIDYIKIMAVATIECSNDDALNPEMS